jgi:hypothetical protein|tara:strand:+ start:2179 stop:2319 length:141 start_codon:yes stop_codon:yes gene_type:complete
MKTSKKRTCHVCGKDAIIWDKAKWWCSMLPNPGQYNLTGACKKEKK